MRTVTEILQERKPGGDFEGATTLIDDRVIDSLTMVALVAELEDEYDIEVPPVEIVADNFNSVEAMEMLVRRLREEERDSRPIRTKTPPSTKHSCRRGRSL